MPKAAKAAWGLLAACIWLTPCASFADRGDVTVDAAAVWMPLRSGRVSAGTRLGLNDSLALQLEAGAGAWDNAFAINVLGGIVAQYDIALYVPSLALLGGMVALDGSPFWLVGARAMVHRFVSPRHALGLGAGVLRDKNSWRLEVVLEGSWQAVH